MNTLWTQIVKQGTCATPATSLMAAVSGCCLPPPAPPSAWHLRPATCRFVWRHPPSSLAALSASHCRPRSATSVFRLPPLRAAVVAKRPPACQKCTTPYSNSRCTSSFECMEYPIKAAEHCYSCSATSCSGNAAPGHAGVNHSAAVGHCAHKAPGSVQSGVADAQDTTRSCWRLQRLAISVPLVFERLCTLHVQRIAWSPTQVVQRSSECLRKVQASAISPKHSINLCNLIVE